MRSRIKSEGNSRKVLFTKRVGACGTRLCALPDAMKGKIVVFVAGDALASPNGRRMTAQECRTPLARISRVAFERSQCQRYKFEQRSRWKHLFGELSGKFNRHVGGDKSPEGALINPGACRMTSQTSPEGVGGDKIKLSRPISCPPETSGRSTATGSPHLTCGYGDIHHGIGIVKSRSFSNTGLSNRRKRSCPFGASRKLASE
ncbi:unnamed protein product, partial [Iphiclides podalirius]